MVKTRYEIDPHNRLVVTGRDKKTGIPLYRKVVDGRFKINTTNTLVYQVTSPVQGPEIPHAVRLRGTWSLTKDHDLKITLEKSKRDKASDELTIAGSILSASGNSLLFAAGTRSADGTRTTYTLEIAGTWQADQHNRLTFRVSKSSGIAAGILVFQGAWEAAKNTLTYTYERRDGIRGTKALQTIAFKGRWEITDRTALTYALDASSNSAFRFRTGIGSFKSNRIEYEVGIGYAKRLRPRIRTIILYGSWHITEGSGLSFDVEAADGGIYAITFTAEARLTGNDTIKLTLRGGTARRALGGSVELSHKILQGDGEAFLRLLKSHEETAVMVGATTRW